MHADMPLLSKIGYRVVIQAEIPRLWNWSGTKVCTGDFAPPEPEFRPEFCETNFERPNFGPEFLGRIF